MSISISASHRVDSFSLQVYANNSLRTETKAITSWPVGQLMGILPKMLHRGLRSSKYYTAGNDSLSLQAQTSRSRTANADDNHQKLFDEMQRVYDETVPNETSPEKRHKYAQL